MSTFDPTCVLVFTLAEGGITLSACDENEITICLKGFST